MPKLNETEFEAFCSVCGSGICENVEVRGDETLPRIVIEPCAKCREAQINYGATLEKEQRESKAPATLRSCECAMLRHQLTLAKQMAAAFESIMSDLRRWKAYGTTLCPADQRMIDTFDRFSEACILTESSRGVECQR
jgi:hypothetical protein